MNRLWQQLAIATNWPVLVAVMVLSSVGIVSIWAISPDLGMRQVAYLVVAIACLAAIQAVNYQLIGRYAWSFYFVSLLLVIYTVIGTKVSLPFVERQKGACAWINFKVVSLEPSELMKISFIMVLGQYLRFRTNYRTLKGLIAPFALALVPVVLILKQPDLGVAALFFPTLLAMLFVAGARGRHILLIVVAGLALLPLFWMHMVPYQKERVTAMFSNDPRTLREGGYQQLRTLTAMGRGGVDGQGIGNLAVGRSVPEAYNDMIFAIVGEQFGFIGSMVVLVAYIILFAAGIEISAETREPFGKLMALGIVALLAAQAFLNLMVVMRLFPVTGVTLPFVSYGGSSLLASYVAAGLLLNIGQNRPVVIAKDSFEFDRA